MHARAGVVGAAGLEQAGQLAPGQIYRQVSAGGAKAIDELYNFVEPGTRLDGSKKLPVLGKYWKRAQAGSFEAAA